MTGVQTCALPILVFGILLVCENSIVMYVLKKKKKLIQGVLVDCQRGIGGTLRVKPLTYGHGPNFGSPKIWT